MTDPRKEPGFKHKPINDKIVMLLGAILDALQPKAAEPVVDAPATPAIRRKRDKAE